MSRTQPSGSAGWFRAFRCPGCERIIPGPMDALALVVECDDCGGVREFAPVKQAVADGGDPLGPELEECPVCGAVGLPERIEDHDCEAFRERRGLDDGRLVTDGGVDQAELDVGDVRPPKQRRAQERHHDKPAYPTAASCTSMVMCAHREEPADLVGWQTHEPDDVIRDWVHWAAYVAVCRTVGVTPSRYQALDSAVPPASASVEEFHAYLREQAEDDETEQAPLVTDGGHPPSFHVECPQHDVAEPDHRLRAGAETACDLHNGLYHYGDDAESGARVVMADGGGPDSVTVRCRECGREFESLDAIEAHDCTDGGDEGPDAGGRRVVADGGELAFEDVRDLWPTPKEAHRMRYRDSRDCSLCGCEMDEYDHHLSLSVKSALTEVPTAYRVVFCEDCGSRIADYLGIPEADR